MARTFIDLGLPSGTLWATENEPGYHQFDKAVETFGEMLPTIEAWQEIIKNCKRKWDDKRDGHTYTGPNGNTIFLPAAGLQYWDHDTKKLIDTTYEDDIYGYYWSSSIHDKTTAYNICFYNGAVYPQDNSTRYHGFSVRLCKKP